MPTSSAEPDTALNLLQPETLDLGYSLQWLHTFPRMHEPENTTKIFFSYPSDWPGVFWLDEPEGGFLPVAGQNVGGSGRWYDSYGGRCSGRQAPFGFWCSWANPRSNLPSDPQTPYGMPGGFTFENTDGSRAVEPARIGHWKNASGAVYHISSGFLSIQCLVDRVENETVHFDHEVGCDQGGPQPPTEGWYVDNVQVSAAEVTKLIPVTDAVRFICAVLLSCPAGRMRFPWRVLLLCPREGAVLHLQHHRPTERRRRLLTSNDQSHFQR
eukprot:COSAG02_NODE_878_length_16266_cov_8.886559_7_plen_269_part_00